MSSSSSSFSHSAAEKSRGIAYVRGGKLFNARALSGGAGLYDKAFSCGDKIQKLFFSCVGSVKPFPLYKSGKDLVENVLFGQRFFFP